MNMDALFHHGISPRIVSERAKSSSSAFSASSSPMKLTSENPSTSMSCIEKIEHDKEHCMKLEEELQQHQEEEEEGSSSSSSQIASGFSSSISTMSLPSKTALSCSRLLLPPPPPPTTTTTPTTTAAAAGAATATAKENTPLRFIIPSSHVFSKSILSTLKSTDKIIKPLKEPKEIEAEPLPEMEEIDKVKENRMKCHDKSTFTQEPRGEREEEEEGGKKRPRKSNDSLSQFATTKKSRGNENVNDNGGVKEVLLKTNRSTKSKARPGLRKGKWSHEESMYAAKLTYFFKEGLLPLERGTMLRLYLSQKLNCEPMRITKKFTKEECIGKQVFRPRSPFLSDTNTLIEEAKEQLVALEASFLKKLKENKEECPPMSQELQKFIETNPVLNSNDLSITPHHTTKGFSSDTTSEDDTEEEEEEEEDTEVMMMMMDDASAVGLLLDFFYKANRFESKENHRRKKNNKRKIQKQIHMNHY